MGTDDERRARIVELWRAIELFSPPAVEKVDPRRKVFRHDGGPLPWQSGHRLARITLAPHLTWRHRILLGCYPLRKATESMAAAFGDDPETHDARLDQETALAAVLVDADGRFVLGSPLLSASAWATGRLARHGSFAVEDFEAAQKEVDDRLTELFVPLAGDDDAAPVDGSVLEQARDIVVDLLEVRDVLGAGEIRVQSLEVAKRRSSEPADDFLNSFLVGDLTTVAENVREGRYGPALGAYLGTDQPERVDLREHPDLALRATHPWATPAGRWPADPRHSLALSQQFAVNEILGAGSPVYAVNGPPGTGKTTMLRDLVAGIVVRRAEALAALTDPADAFTGSRSWTLCGRAFTVNLWRPDLVGHEIVVASSNNGAVENVTLEIPGKAAVDERWLPAGEHFRDIATALLQREAWGLVAAMLGKRENRNRFAATVWFGSKDGDAVPTLRDELAAARPVEPWPACVDRFRRALAAAADAQNKRAVAHEALASLPQAQAAHARAVADVEQAAARRAVAERDLAAHRDALERAQRAVAEHEAARGRHQESRPKVLRGLLDRQRTRAWRADDEKLADRVREARARLDALREDDLDRTLRDACAVQVSARARLADADHGLRHQEAVVREARAAWGSAVPGDMWWTDERLRELAAPWSDPEIGAARTGVFLAALRLHRDFLAHQAAAMQQNLRTAIDILVGTAPRDLDEDIAQAAWQSLFFVVPVVSTTFASFGRMFSHLGAEALGWLFVDEAGQAAPQNAVGAVWRARRCVVVGDPLQLEPVSTLPVRAQESLRRAAGVDERWLPAGRSVQTLADATMPVGTWLPDGDGGRRWVGAPLRVHRRCDDPMFTAVNEIVYGGLMISAVGRRPAFTLPDGRCMPQTKWLDVPAATAERHWVPAEGERLRELLAYLIVQGFDLADVLVISPFRDVARETRRILATFGGTRGGTIHTAQGKEADIVVLVLGGDPARPGARQWAAAAPNLLNVAVSRARRRLYVIGDRSAWQQQRYFADLARLLPYRE